MCIDLSIQLEWETAALSWSLRDLIYSGIVIHRLGVVAHKMAQGNRLIAPQAQASTAVLHKKPCTPNFPSFLIRDMSNVIPDTPQTFNIATSW